MAASCERERRDLSSAKAMIEMTRFEVAERRRTVDYAYETRQQGRGGDYTPPQWLVTPRLERMEDELARRQGEAEAARASLDNCLTWAWRDSGSPTSLRPVRGGVPRSEPGRSALRGDMVGTTRPAAPAVPITAPTAIAARNRALGADPRERRSWRDRYRASDKIIYEPPQ